MTPDLAALWQAGKLDVRCLDCGAGSAATARCYRCGSRNLDYIAHAKGRPCLAWSGGATHQRRPRSASPRIKSAPPLVTGAEVHP